VPLTEAELKATPRTSKPILDEEWALDREYEEGARWVGAALRSPTTNKCLERLNGRPTAVRVDKGAHDQAQIDSGRSVCC